MRTVIARIRTVYARFVAVATPRCHEVTRLLSQGMDRPLPWYVRLRLRLHFAGCVWCRRYAEQLRQIRFFSRKFPEKAGEQGTVVLPSSSRERFKAAVGREVAARQTSSEEKARD